MSSSLDDSLKNIIVLFENLLKLDFPLIFEGKSVDLDLGASAKNTLRDGNSFFSWMMLNIIGAFVSVSATVVLIPARWILVAFLAEVSVSTAAELGSIAAEVALVLEVAKAMLVTHELLTDAHIL